MAGRSDRDNGRSKVDEVAGRPACFSYEAGNCCGVERGSEGWISAIPMNDTGGKGEGRCGI
jgi:hypothetical protein